MNPARWEKIKDVFAWDSAAGPNEGRNRRIRNGFTIQTVSVKTIANSFVIPRTATGDDQEDRLTVDTGANQGVVHLDYDLLTVPDTLRVYYNGVRLFDTGFTNSAASVDIPFGPGPASQITIVVNEGGGQLGTAWFYTATILTGNAAETRLAIGGNFTAVNGLPRSRVAVLNGDGSVNSAFDPGAGGSSTVYALGMHTNAGASAVFGKVTVGGDFAALAGARVSRIARLNSDGTLDGTFNVGSGANGAVRSLAIQSDGRVLTDQSRAPVRAVVPPLVDEDNSAASTGASP